MKTAEESGEFSYIPIRFKGTNDDEEEESFDDANEIPTQSATTIINSSVNNKLTPPVNSKETKVSSMRREISGTSKASSIISTAATAGSGRRTSLSDVEKELQDFDL